MQPSGGTRASQMMPKRDAWLRESFLPRLDK